MIISRHLVGPIAYLNFNQIRVFSLQPGCWVTADELTNVQDLIYI